MNANERLMARLILSAATYAMEEECVDRDPARAAGAGIRELQRLNPNNAKSIDDPGFFHAVVSVINALTQAIL